MTTFFSEASGELSTKINDYDVENQKQQWKAKADFLRLIESSMVKLHDLTNLNGLEKVELKEAIIDKRDAFGTAVATWASDLKDEMDKVFAHDS